MTSWPGMQSAGSPAARWPPLAPGPLGHLLAAVLAGAATGAADGLLATLRNDLEPLRPAAHWAAAGLGAALHLPVAALLGLLLGFGASLLRRAGGVRALRRPVVLVALLVLAGAAGVALYLRLRGRELDLRAVDPTGPALLVGGAMAYGLLLVLLRRLVPEPRAIAATLLPPVLLGASSGLYAHAGAARGEVLLRLDEAGALSARLLRHTLALLDGDGDGFPRLLCTAGCDCDDRNPAISPAAWDLPGNGIDEDCSGADANAAEEERFGGVFAASSRPAAPPPEARAEESEGRSQASEQHRQKRRRRAEHHRGDRLAKRCRRGRSGACCAAPKRERGVRLAKQEQHRREGTRGLLAMSTRSDGVPTPRQRRPNVLLITIDTLRADHLGTYGYPYPTSPRIDAWARSAVVFEQARAAGPATRFSIPAMLTGKHFTEVYRSSGEWPRIDDREVMLAERLRAAGYFTAAVHSVVYLQDRYGFGQGFAYRDFSFFRYAQDVWRTPTADYVTDRVLQLAERGQLQSHGPFFLWAYYGDPHAPHMKHPGFFSEGPRWSAAYDSEVAFSDHHVGRLLDGLREHGLLEDSYVILTADHGEGLDRKMDHGSRHHSKNLYDELLRVPLIIAGPGLAPRRVATPVSLIDLVPTVLELIGQSEEARDPVLRGESLMPYLRGESPPHRPTFAEKHRAEDAVQKCMVLWPYKVIVVYPYNDYSIYDLSRDPREQSNIATALPARERERLLGTFRYWATHILRPTPDNPRH